MKQKFNFSSLINLNTYIRAYILLLLIFNIFYFEKNPRDSQRNLRELRKEELSVLKECNYNSSSAFLSLSSFVLFFILFFI